MNKQQLENLDWINVKDLKEETTGSMIVLDSLEKDGRFYLLTSLTEPDEDIYEEDLEDEDSDEEEAFILKICSREEADFEITDDYSDLLIYATNDLPADEFDTVSDIFFRAAEDYELNIEE
ncbi:MAG: hypothetical protein J6P72_08530 [Firmicutes bacterium]|nr:hypothetical protein [Bacillota bacterium]